MPKAPHITNSERHGSENQSPMLISVDQPDRQRFSNNHLVESKSSGSTAAPIAFPHMFKRVMQAYPTYPNSALMAEPVTTNHSVIVPAPLPKVIGIKKKISKALKMSPHPLLGNGVNKSGVKGQETTKIPPATAPPTVESEKANPKTYEGKERIRRKSKGRDEDFRPYPPSGNHEGTLRTKKSGEQNETVTIPEVRRKHPKTKIAETHKTAISSEKKESKDLVDENNNVEKRTKRALTALGCVTNNRTDSTPGAPVQKPPTSNSKLATKKISPIERNTAHLFTVEPAKKTVHFEAKPFTGEKIQDNGDKYSILMKKLKAQTQATKNLKRQNGCLESIITQKRNLVEQLTRQVRGLLKENFELAKGTLVDPNQENIPTDSASSAGNPPAQPDENSNGNSNENVELTASSSTPNLPTTNENPTQEVDCKRGGSKENLPKLVVSRSKTTIANKRSSKLTLSKKQARLRSADRLEEYDKQIEALQSANDALQKQFENLKSESMYTNQFLGDLLYTLNARGYESIIDNEGKIVDLYRCQGDHLLELKGRDARLKTPVKRMTPQETLLKAVIGSQEKLIQSLFIQLDTRTREAMLANKLSLEGGARAGGSSPADESRNASLEAEILELVGLIEGSCQRNPEVLGVLYEQAVYDRDSRKDSGSKAKNVMIDAVLDRCARAIAGSSPPSPRPKPTSPPPIPLRSPSPKPGSSRQSKVEEQDNLIPSAPPQDLISQNTEIFSNKLVSNRPHARTNAHGMTSSKVSNQKLPNV